MPWKTYHTLITFLCLLCEQFKIPLATCLAQFRLLCALGDDFFRTLSKEFSASSENLHNFFKIENKRGKKQTQYYMEEFLWILVKTIEVHNIFVSQ